MDLQKVGSAADSCVFSGLRAGSLYKLQVVSWSRDMSSESSVLARTGQSVLLYGYKHHSYCLAFISFCPHLFSPSRYFFHVLGIYSDSFSSSIFPFYFLKIFFLFVPPLLCSPISSLVSTGREFRMDGQTGSQLAAWRGKL